MDIVGGVVLRSDIAIVGGGPGGAWAAYLLARQGARVTVFDGSHPREKACGGGVTRRALDFVAPALAGRDVPGVTVESARFESGPHRAAVALADPTISGPALVVASRAAFDGALISAAEEAGARRVTDRVVDVAIEPHGVAVSTRRGVFRAGWLIGADGATSLVRRRRLGTFRRSDLSIATGFYAHGRSSRDIVVRFVSNPPGYIWSFPRPDHLAIGICAQADQAASGPLRRELADWMRRTGIASDSTLVPYAWPIPSLTADSWRRERPAGDRWMLVGDAAGLVDPITREGIVHALHSADLAVRALGASTDPAGHYLDRLRTDIVTELAHAARLKAGFFRPRFIGLLMRALHSSAGVRAVMADLVAGRQPYATLKRRLLGTLEVGLAWQLFRLERTRG